MAFAAGHEGDTADRDPLIPHPVGSGQFDVGGWGEVDASGRSVVSEDGEAVDEFGGVAVGGVAGEFEGGGLEASGLGGGSDDVGVLAHRGQHRGRGLGVHAPDDEALVAPEEGQDLGPEFGGEEGVVGPVVGLGHRHRSTEETGVVGREVVGVESIEGVESFGAMEQQGADDGELGVEVVGDGLETEPGLGIVHGRPPGRLRAWRRGRGRCGRRWVGRRRRRRRWLRLALGLRLIGRPQ